MVRSTCTYKWIHQLYWCYNNQNLSTELVYDFTVLLMIFYYSIAEVTLWFKLIDIRLKSILIYNELKSFVKEHLKKYLSSYYNILVLLQNLFQPIIALDKWILFHSMIIGYHETIKLVSNQQLKTYHKPRCLKDYQSEGAINEALGIWRNFSLEMYKQINFTKT